MLMLFKLAVLSNAESMTLSGYSGQDPTFTDQKVSSQPLKLVPPAQKKKNQTIHIQKKEKKKETTKVV